eukprot:UN08368
MGNAQVTSTSFESGDVAETEYVDRYGKTHWIDVRINNVNKPEPLTYDIEVIHAKQLRVNPYAIHVPGSKLREKEYQMGQWWILDLHKGTG